MWPRMWACRMKTVAKSHLIRKEVLTFILKERLKLIENFVRTSFFVHMNCSALHSLIFIWENILGLFSKLGGRKLSHNRHVTTRVCLLIDQSPLEAKSDRAFPKLNCHATNGHFGDTADIWACRYTVPYRAVSSTAVSGEHVASVCFFRLIS